MSPMYHSNKMTHNNILLCRKRERFENTQVYTQGCVYWTPPLRDQRMVWKGKEKECLETLHPQIKSWTSRKKGLLNQHYQYMFELTVPALDGVLAQKWVVDPYKQLIATCLQKNSFLLGSLTWKSILKGFLHEQQ